MLSPGRLSMEVTADAIQEDRQSIDKYPDVLRESFLLWQRRRLECKG
jgi:hypothetical protein